MGRANRKDYLAETRVLGRSGSGRPARWAAAGCVRRGRLAVV